MKKNIYSCQNNDYKGIEVKIIMGENDPANLRLYEALYMRKYKPTLNFLPWSQRFFLIFLRERDQQQAAKRRQRVA